MRLITLRKFLADPDVAIDLGTANTRLYVLGRGLVADEPTLVHANAELIVRGSEQAGRRQDDLVAPLQGGVVRDVDAAAYFLSGMLKRARRFGLFRSRALVCVPSGVTSAERSNLVQAVHRSGVAAVKLVPETLASAVGAGLDISLPYAQLIVDIGHGVTDVAVIRSHRLVRARAMRRACGDLRSAVERTVARRKDLFLYRREAERLVHESGAVAVIGAARSLPALGLDRQGCETKVELSGQEISEAVNPVINKIVKGIRETVQGLSPQLAVEVMESGICLTGGGAYLRGLDQLIAAATSIDVKVAADPLHAAINGASQMLATSAGAELWESRSL